MKRKTDDYYIVVGQFEPAVSEARVACRNGRVIDIVLNNKVPLLSYRKTVDDITIQITCSSR